MTLTAPPPTVYTATENYRPVADELAKTGHAGLLRRARTVGGGEPPVAPAGKYAFEEITYRHDPRLPSSFGDLGAPSMAVCNIVRSDDRRRPRPWLVWVHGAGQGGLTDFVVAGQVDPPRTRLQRRCRYSPDTVSGASRGRPTLTPTRWPMSWDDARGVGGAGRHPLDRPQATVIARCPGSRWAAGGALVSGMEPAVDAVALYTPIPASTR